jgi:hypothetical protein
VSAGERSVVVDHGGRGGRVTYPDASGVLELCWEGAASGFEIAVPTAARWEEATGLPLAIRTDTLAFIAAGFIAQRGTPRSTFEIVEEPYAFLVIHV